MKKNELVWNVYTYNINVKRIEPHNVFDHFRFMNDVINANKKYEDDTVFVNKVRSELMCYYWSKCEWEICIGPLAFDDECKCDKIDVFQQIKMNWDAFVEYLLAHRKDIRKTKMKR